MNATLSLKMVLPNRVFHEETVHALRAIGAHGSFALRPRHIDCVVALVPGILSCASEDEETRRFAVDGGILVKCGSEVFVSTPHAVRGEPGINLKETVRQSFRELAVREERTRSALRKIEADFVRTFVEVEENVV